MCIAAALAILASAAAMHTRHLIEDSVSGITALNGGYQLAFALAAAFALAGAILSLFITSNKTQSNPETQLSESKLSESQLSESKNEL